MWEHVYAKVYVHPKFTSKTVFFIELDDGEECISSQYVVRTLDLAFLPSLYGKVLDGLVKELERFAGTKNTR